MRPLSYIFRVIGQHMKALANSFDALGELAETIARIHEIENSQRHSPADAMAEIRKELDRYSRLSALRGTESGHEVDRSTGERKPA